MTSESEKNDAGLVPVAGFRPLADLSTGFMFLTRLPIPGDGSRPLSAAAWTFPVVGAFVGALGGLVYWAALWLGLTPLIAALLAVATTAAVTGALHEDGLSDAADGLWGGHNPEKRLEIMRDSRIGGFGALALVISVGLRVSALATLRFPDGVLVFLIAAHALSRGNLVLFMSGMRLAGKSGLAATAGRPGLLVTGIAFALGLGIAFAMTGLYLTPMGVATVCGISLALSWLFMAVVRVKLGGYNGDSLGAAQQIGEIVLLLAILGWINNMGLA